MTMMPSSSIIATMAIISIIINPVTDAYCLGNLRERDIAGIWRLSKKSFLPTSTDIPYDQQQQKRAYPMKEFTVYPKKKMKHPSSSTNSNDGNGGGGSSSSSKNNAKDILLLLREDGHFIQYASQAEVEENKKNRRKRRASSSNLDYYDKDGNINNSIEDETNVYEGEMKGSWALVDGTKLILAADRRSEMNNIRAEAHNHDTILEGRVVAISTNSTDETSAGSSILSSGGVQTGGVRGDTGGSDGRIAGDGTTPGSSGGDSSRKTGDRSSGAHAAAMKSKEDVHLSVPKGKVKIGKFFYPQKHPSFFEQPIFDPTPTGSFELRQVLGNLNLGVDDEDELIEKFRKTDLMDKRYLLTSYPLPKRKKKKRWSIKHSKYVDDKPKTKKDKEWEELQKNAPIQIKTFEVDLFANNTFQTVTGLGDTILRGKWSIIGPKRDQLWMKVWRFGFGRDVSGSTYSEGSTLSHNDDVAYWGEILEEDTSEKLDSIEDEPKHWKGTKIEINGSVMFGGLEPTSISRFTMIEKTEEDDYDYEEDEDEDEDGNDDLGFPNLRDDIGSFE
jgi:hypothetical protein